MALHARDTAKAAKHRTISQKITYLLLALVVCSVTPLLAVASRFPGFPILLETYRECLKDVFDLPALVEGGARAGQRAEQRTRLLPRRRLPHRARRAPAGLTSAALPCAMAGRVMVVQPPRPRFRLSATGKDSPPARRREDHQAASQGVPGPAVAAH